MDVKPSSFLITVQNPAYHGRAGRDRRLCILAGSEVLERGLDKPERCIDAVIMCGIVVLVEQFGIIPWSAVAAKVELYDELIGSQTEGFCHASTASGGGDDLSLMSAEVFTELVQVENSGVFVGLSCPLSCAQMTICPGRFKVVLRFPVPTGPR